MQEEKQKKMKGETQSYSQRNVNKFLSANRKNYQSGVNLKLWKLKTHFCATFEKTGAGGFQIKALPIYQGTAVGVVLLGCAHRSGETMAGDITRHFDGTAVMAGIKMGPSWERWRLVAVCKDFCLL